MKRENLCILLFICFWGCQQVSKKERTKEDKPKVELQTVSGWLVHVKNAFIFIPCQAEKVILLSIFAVHLEQRKVIENLPFYQPIWIKIKGEIKNQSASLHNVPYQGDILLINKQFTYTQSIKIDTNSQNNCAFVWPLKTKPIWYTAFGSEPGWRVNISPQKIKLISNYGKNKYTFERIKRKLKGEKLIFSATNKDLKIIFLQQNCTAPSGKPYPFAVRVAINGKILTGCGKAIYTK